MAILIDPPLWPAHGTHFSHLVSDSSLDQLHEFAAAAEIPSRAFDLDHYDVPAERHADLVARGAVAVSGGELVRRLIASGLRVPARRRPGKLEHVLLQHWNALIPGQDPLGRELIARWGEDHRHYHDHSHLLAVLEALRTLQEHGERPGAESRAVWLAAWFHDAVYKGVAGKDEEDSAALAHGKLSGAGCQPEEVAESVRLVLLTAHHAPADDDASGAMLCDADLSILGSRPDNYRRYLAAVRKEYAHVGDADFAAGRAAVVRRLLALEPLYRTDTARKLWLGQARQNLGAELAET